MSRPRETVLKALRKNLPKGSKLLVAVSGGIDSMALLHGSSTLQHELSLTLAIAHVNHGLRPEAKTDAAFVKSFSDKLNLDFHLLEAVPPAANENLEAWGRKIRYSFFKRLIAQHCYDMVLTAHTADDAAETLLMRLLSNKELNGIQSFDPKRKCLRPLLSVPRSEIEAYAALNKLEFRNDASNEDTTFLRNRIRHILLPFLADHFDKRIIETLSTRAAAVSDDISLLYGLVSKSQNELQPHKFGSREWLREFQSQLFSTPTDLRWRLVELVFKEELHFNLGRYHSKTLERFLLGNASCIELPSGFTIRRKNGGLQIHTLEESSDTIYNDVLS